LTLDGRGLANGLMIADSMDNNVGPAVTKTQAKPSSSFQ
jgi:hypothetical protein